MTVVDKFLKNISYKFPKGYPDMNDADDVALLENILNEMGIELNELTLSTHWSERKDERGSIIDIDADYVVNPTKTTVELTENINEASAPSSGYGYKIGEFTTPSETLASRNWNFMSKIGYMGTGYYFYGNEETAMEDRKFLNREKTENIKKFPLSDYKLFRADNPEEFYDNIKMLTRELGLFASSGEGLSDADLDEALQEIVDIVKNELKLPLSDEQILGAVKSFIRDIQEKNDGTLLSNRLLVPLGFEGIDNTNTNLDNYGVGSVIFTG